MWIRGAEHPSRTSTRSARSLPQVFTGPTGSRPPPCSRGWSGVSGQPGILPQTSSTPKPIKSRRFPNGSIPTKKRMQTRHWCIRIGSICAQPCGTTWGSSGPSNVLNVQLPICSTWQIVSTIFTERFI